MIRWLRRVWGCDHPDGTRRVGHDLDDVKGHREFVCDRCGVRVSQLGLDEDLERRRKSMRQRVEHARDAWKRENAERQAKAERERAEAVKKDTKPIRRVG